MTASCLFAVATIRRPSGAGAHDEPVPLDELLMPDVERAPARIFADRYKVERMIARGGMGEVYLCTDLDLRRPVALKILRGGLDSEDGARFMERFRLEARTLATLSHPNIVTLYEYGEMGDGQLFLALEYIDGPRFTDIARNGPMDPMRVIRLTMQVVRALRFAHRRGVVHRDLKPGNLLLRVDEDGEEQIKVVDFGLVKVMEDDQSLTRAGLILGSPHCMAPEQIRGLKDVDHRADIYAVGVLMFRAITGQWPFHGETSTATMIAHINQQVPRFVDVVPDVVVPPNLENVVRKCLQKDPARRYQDINVLMADLRSISGQPATVTYSDLSINDSNPSSILGAPSEAVTAGETVMPSLPSPESLPIPKSAPALSGQLALVGLGVGMSVLLLVVVVVVWSIARWSEADAPLPSAAPSVTAPVVEAQDAIEAAPEPVVAPAAAQEAPPPPPPESPPPSVEAPATPAPAARKAKAPPAKEPETAPVEAKAPTGSDETYNAEDIF